MLTFGSLFSGVGGFDLGFDRAGLRCKWQVERDNFRRAVLAKHWPGVERWDDVRTFPPSWGKWGVDVIAGGFPCTQTSTAAAIHDCRSGLAGSDSGLWFEMLRIVRLLQPRFVVVENVGGASTWKNAITNGLADAGYVVPVEPLSLPAELFGAPHTRRRLFWIADIDGKGLEIARQAESLATECVPRRTTDGNDWLASLPGIRGMDDGLSDWVDRRKRIESCGNAVVPQVAEWIGRRIIESLSQRST